MGALGICIIGLIQVTHNAPLKNHPLEKGAAWPLFEVECQTWLESQPNKFSSVLQCAVGERCTGE